MRFGKPHWINHKGLPIHCVDMQPLGFRIVTGGSDWEIKIWNVIPILSSYYESEEIPAENESLSELDKDINEYVQLAETAKIKPYQRFLGSLTFHQGPINVLKWSSDGTMFASGSDDTIVAVWKLTDVKEKEVEGNKERREIWTNHKCFKGHTAGK